MIKVIHNNSCPKSKAILEYLDENDIKFQIIDIRKDPLSLFELRTLFKKYFSESESVNDEQALEVIALNPELIQCPILIKGKIAMPGNPLENVKFFIEN